MNLKKVLLSSVAAVTLTSVAAMAAANVSTTIGQDGTGDYLVFPMYAADDNGNWSTNIKVVNTNTTHAVIGKVVFREWKGSVEKVDFPIFLSPGDVWEGTVAKSGTNVRGLFQITGDTWRAYRPGTRYSTDPYEQAKTASLIVKDLYNKYNGNLDLLINSTEERKKDISQYIDLLKYGMLKREEK